MKKNWLLVSLILVFGLIGYVFAQSSIDDTFRTMEKWLYEKDSSKPSEGRDYTSKKPSKKPPDHCEETIIVSNDKPIKVKSNTLLEQGRWYIIEANGVISDWSHVKDGVDAVWCYAEWRCGKQGQVWDQLRIDGKGMTEIAGKIIPYNPQHIYQVRYQGQGKQVELYCSDAQDSSSDNSGSFTVKIIPENCKRVEGRDYTSEGRDYTSMPRVKGRDYTSKERKTESEINPNPVRSIRKSFGY